MLLAKKSVCEKKRSKSKKYYLGKTHPHVYFTLREAQCMKYFLKRKTNEEVARLLNISVRTVRFYLKNIKLKMQCGNKAEIVKQIRLSELVNQLLKI